MKLMIAAHKELFSFVTSVWSSNDFEGVMLLRIAAQSKLGSTEVKDCFVSRRMCTLHFAVPAVVFVQPFNSHAFHCIPIFSASFFAMTVETMKQSTVAIWTYRVIHIALF